MNDNFDALFDSFFGNRGIGFDRLFHHVNHINPTNFPPHNLVKLNDEEMILSMALAGYTEDNIDISVENNMLKVTGELPQEDDLEYIHRGIATRKFTKSFALHEDLEIVGAAMTNGMLHIRFKHTVPEEKKPKKIPIFTNKKEAQRLLE
jgi:molecular chaperone IbpA